MNVFFCCPKILNYQQNIIDFNTFKEVTTNPGEGLNNLILFVMKKAVRSCDVLNLSLYQLSIYYSNEIQLGYSNSGNFKLKESYISMLLDKNHIDVREQKSIEEIIDIWRDGIFDSSDSNSSDSDFRASSNTINDSPSSPVDLTENQKSSSSSETTLQNNEEADTDQEAEELEKEPIVRLQGPATLKAIRAKELANSDKIVFDEKNRIWNVNDNGTYNIVKLYPLFCTR